MTDVSTARISPRPSPVTRPLSIRVLVSVTALLAFAMAALLLWIGPPLTVLAPWDVVIHIDESWRIFSGQAPHRDFHNAVGSFAYDLSALGMHIVGPRLYGIVVGNVIFLGLATLLGAFVAYRRLAPLLAFFFTLFVILLASGLCQVGRPADLPGYVEVYNRYGWTLACILLLQVFLPVRPGLTPLPVLEGALAGLTLTLIVFTKVTFGVFTAIALLFALLVTSSWRDRRFMLAMIGAGLVSTAAMYAVVGDSVFAYAADVLRVGPAQDLERRISTAKNTVRGGAISVLILGVAWGLFVLLPAARGAMRRIDAVRLTAVSAVIGATALLIGSANTGEGGEMPLLFVLGLYIFVAAGLATGAAGPAQRDWTRAAGLAIVLVGLAGPIMLRDAQSLWNGVTSREYRTELVPAVQLFESESMRDMVIPHDTEWVTEYWRTAELPARINDGLEMMRREVEPGSTILTLSFSNPFPFALQFPSPRGTPVWFDHGLNFNDKVFPDAGELFADVDYVALPIILDTDDYLGGRKTTDTLRGVYGGYLDSHYTEAGRSAHWILLRRNDLQASLQPGRKEVG